MRKHIELPQVAQTLDYTCGAACFDSMYQFLRGASLGEMHFAKELGALELGYTPIENIVTLAKNYNFNCEIKKNSNWEDLENAFLKENIIFVTWWDEDAGHYSLVKLLETEFVLLMDPWSAREGLDNKISKENFISHWNARGGVMISISN